MNILQKTILIFFVFGLSGCGGRSKTKVQIYDVRAKSNTEVIVNNEVSELDIVLPKPEIVEDAKSRASYVNNNYLLDPNKVIELSISRKGYTRFSIEEERITDVFIFPQEAVQVRIHNQGYLIIVSEAEHVSSNEQIYVTITGEQGTTQDFSLHFTGKAPEPVKFIKPKPEQNFDKIGE